MNRGIYQVKLSLPANSIECNANMGSNAYQFRVWYSIPDVNRGTGSFSVIGKNGVSLMSENCNIFMNDDKIEFTAGNLRTNPNYPSLYGIRITPNGMYYCNDGSSWISWNPGGSSGTSSGTSYDDTELVNKISALETTVAHLQSLHDSSND